MTSKAIALALILTAGCGNYSNEDLEFMNALPASDQLAASIPPRSSAIAAADEAELARTTHNVTMTFNGIVEQFMGLVDGIRSYSPTTRAPNIRTWGPFDAMDHPGWQVRMVITRSVTADATLFQYEIDFHQVGGDDADWPAILSGQFQADGTARRGIGTFEVQTAAVLAEGLDPGFGRLDHMTVAYSTSAFPVTVSMHVWNLPDPTMPNAVAQANYTYKAAADGQGEMSFDLFGNLVPGPQDEQVTVTSQWLGTGEGRSSLSVVSGDAAGLTQTECWNARFVAVFNDKPWAPAEDVGGDSSACVQIALLD